MCSRFQIIQIVHDLQTDDIEQDDLENHVHQKNIYLSN